MTIQISLPKRDMLHLIKTLAEVTVKLEYDEDPKSVIIDWLGHEIAYQIDKKYPKALKNI